MADKYIKKCATWEKQIKATMRQKTNKQTNKQKTTHNETSGH